MLAALASGILLGFSAGLSPGPMLALVLAQALRHGPREGCKVALTPLVTDPPIIVITVLIAAQLAEVGPLLGIVSIAGAMFVLFLAWESFRPPRRGADTPPERPRSWAKGIITNLLNPHPWIFWLTVGAALLAKTIQEGWLVAGTFLLAFYVLLVGSKMGIAWIAGRYREVLSGKGYRVTMQILAILLALFAVLLFREGIKHMRD